MALRYLKQEDVDAFFKVIKNTRDRTIFSILYVQGLRVGEVVGEHLEYWTRNGVRITNSNVPQEVLASPVNTKVEHKGAKYSHIDRILPGLYFEDIDWDEKMLEIKGKGAKPRLVPLFSDMKQQLEEYAWFVAPDQDPHKLIGKMFDIEPPQVRKLCHAYCRDAGIKRRIHPHAFRHTFARNYLADGGRINVLRDILGHSSLAVTEKYLQLLPEDLKRDVDRVDMLRDAKLKNDEVDDLEEQKKTMQKRLQALGGVK